MKLQPVLFIALWALLLPVSCRQGEAPDVPEGEIIRIAGVETAGTVETKSPAEETPWLASILKEGMDVKYGLDKKRATARVARLTLKDEDVADKYSFRDKDRDIASRWMDNGAHFFEGVYVPTDLTGGDWVTADQSGGHYTTLSQYLCLPPAFTQNATVARINLPLQHRLSRVLAYILIDPSLGDNVTIAGYDTSSGQDNPSTSKIRFCNVSVLAGVTSNVPQWNLARKVIPHFVEEKENFVAYYDPQKKTYYYPTSTEETPPAGYEETVYKTVPVYDLIVRPTYTQAKTVMYDEAEAGFSLTNKIDFEVTLSNDLQYTREFDFDLDANHETIVYLRIGRKSVDYNSSGSELWVETKKDDGYYGADHETPADHNLSHAGSSWQRAYKIGTLGVEETDGKDYDGTQYVNEETWVSLLAEAYEGGEHHGDYFILTENLSINASKLPENFVFTGHLDGMDHTLTITGLEENDYVFEGLNGSYTVDKEGEANVHWESNKWVPLAGWRAEIMNTKFVVEGNGKLIDRESVSGYLHNNWLGDNRLEDYTPTLPQY